MPVGPLFFKFKSLNREEDNICFDFELLKNFSLFTYNMGKIRTHNIRNLVYYDEATNIATCVVCQRQFKGLVRTIIDRHYLRFHYHLLINDKGSVALSNSHSVRNTQAKHIQMNGNPNRVLTPEEFAEKYTSKGSASTSKHVSSSTALKNNQKGPENTSKQSKRDQKQSDEDRKMRTFVKTYGTAFKRGLEVLPPKEAIDFATEVLRQLNERIWASSILEAEPPNETDNIGNEKDLNYENDPLEQNSNHEIVPSPLSISDDEEPEPEHLETEKHQDPTPEVILDDETDMLIKVEPEDPGEQTIIYKIQG